jgi:amino acid adenylation domain-containing protein/FkbM family methyltransferase
MQDAARTASRFAGPIAQIWCEVLKLEDVGADEDFFTLGGDSLRAVEMLTAVEDLLLTPVAFPDFIDAPTVSGLAAAVESAREAQRTRPERAPDRKHHLPTPCTFAQERLWFLDQLTGPTGAYNIPLGFRIRGGLDVDALEQALLEVVRRHNALRTTFAADRRGPFQVVVDQPRLELERLDVSAAVDPETAAREAVDAMVSAPFQLERGPLCRALVVRLGDDHHVLELVFDHIVCDGWSEVVILDELAALYDDFSHGVDPSLLPADVQYDDHARRERERLTDAVIEDELVYWRKRLAGIPATLDLPTDRPRPARPSFQGGTLRVHLPEATAEAVRSFARVEGATLVTTLLAVYDVLLHRYTGQQTIVVGSTSAARDRPELRGAVGLYASTVAVRADLDGDTSFRDVLSVVRRSVLEAIAHQDLPFDRLVADLAPERDMSRHPIFQVLFGHVPVLRLAIEDTEPFDASPSKARVDLTLWVQEEEGGIDLVWEYSTDLFERSSIERLQRHFISLLEAALRDPDRPIGELELMPAAERERLVARCAGGRKVFPVACLHELFEEQAATTPDATAVVFEGAALSYHELNERANRLAHVLRSVGVASETYVALFLERSLDLVVAILGVLKAGGAYVPLDPGYPSERVAFALDDAAAAVLITQERLLERLPAHQATTICLDRDAELMRGASGTNPEQRSSPHDAAYVIYTSGSTGRPKGVTIEHRNVARLFSATAHWFGFGPADTWLLLHSYAFDFSVWELWGALLHGGRLVVVPHWTSRSPASLRDLVIDARVTVLNATPSLFLTMLDELLSAADAWSLRVVVLGGEALQPAALRSWFDRVGEAGPRLVNMYGITETTVHVSYRLIGRADCGRDVSPIGEPIPDLETYVLDTRLNPVPEGVPGELFIGGAGVGRGYLNRPQLTAERFLPNPFGPGVLYRTGDRARQLDGELLYLGRTDDQVKIRGYRIELGEIESVLREHPAVREALVVARDEAGQKRLVAYVVPERGTSLSADELRPFAEALLPAFMIPSVFVTVESFPLTHNGKLDRMALPPPAARAEAEFVMPTTETERRIAAMWREILSLETVGSNGEFFRLGGHSLLAARVVARVREEFGVELPVRLLFDRPVLAAFAAEIDARRAQGEGRARGEAEGPDKPDPAVPSPLSFQQQQLLFLDDLSRGSATYNAALAFRACGRLDPDCLARAIDLLIGRHDALRTVLRVEDEEAEQLVLTKWQVEIPVIDVPYGGDGLDALLGEYARRPFDLGHDLLLRTFLFRLAPDEHVILFQTHHVAFDAWAVEIFLRELGTSYNAFLEGREPQLPPLALSYRDFARRQRGLLAGEWLEREKAFWREYLAEAPTFLPLPADGPRPDDDVLDADRHAITIPRSIAERLRSVCAEEDVTPYMFLLAAFATLLYRETGQTDLLIGGPAANRGSVDCEGVIGFFANTVVTRIDLAGSPTFRELLARVRRTVLEALEHQELPFELVVDTVAPPRRPGMNPLFQVNFRTRVGPSPTLDLVDAETSSIPIELGLARFDLAFEAHVQDDEDITGEFIYATALFRRARIERLAQVFRRLVEEAVDNPAQRLVSFGFGNESTGGQGNARIRGFRMTGNEPSNGAAARTNNGAPEPDLQTTTLPNGMTIAHVSESETDFLYREIFVDLCYESAAAELREGDVVFDVGANIGLAALYFAMVQPDITVVAFEPAPLPFRALVENLRKHQVRSKFFQCALHRHAGETTFFYYPDNTVMSGLYVDPARDMAATETFLHNAGLDDGDARFIAERRFSVEATNCRLDTVSNVLAREGITDVALLKVDVEGAEADVLAGIAPDDWKRIHRLVVELHDDASAREITQLLRARGFTVEARQDPLLRRTSMSTVEATRPR